MNSRYNSTHWGASAFEDVALGKDYCCATAGEFENISGEIKANYPNPSFIFEGVYRTAAPYRAKLKKNNDYGLNEGIVTFPMKLSGMWSVGIIADNAAYPAAKNPNVVQATLTPEIFAGTIQVGMKTTKAANTGRSAFNSKGVTADRIEENAAEIASYTNRVYAGSNRGRLAIVEADGSSTFTAAKPLGTELLEEGMVLEAYSAHTSGSVRDSFSAHKITAIDHDTRIVTYVKNSDGTTDDRTLVAGDSVYITGTYARTPVSMPDIVDDGTNCAVIYGRTRSTDVKTKAFVLGNGGTLRNLTEQLMMDAISLPKRKAGKKITRILANDGQGRKYLEFVAAQRQYPGATSGDPRFVTGYNDDSLPVVAPGVNARLEEDSDVPPRSVFYLAWDTFFLYEAAALHWVDAENGLLKLSPGSSSHNSAYLAYMQSIENQGNTMPRANSRLDDLKDPICGD